MQRKIIQIQYKKGLENFFKKNKRKSSLSLPGGACLSSLSPNRSSAPSARSNHRSPPRSHDLPRHSPLLSRASTRRSPPPHSTLHSPPLSACRSRRENCRRSNAATAARRPGDSSHICLHSSRW